MGKAKFINDVEIKMTPETVRRREKSHADEDRGWAWVVFVAAVVGRIIVLGTLLTFSIYFSHYLELFGAPRSATGLIGSIMWFLFDLSGLANSVIIRTIGPRMSIMLGSSLLMSSFLLSTLATDIYQLMITQGILLGVSSNLVNLSFAMCIKIYFFSHLNLVQGISTCGAGLGVFIMGLIIPKLLDTYGWRGACVIHGGILFNICIVGATIYSPILATNRKYSPTIIETDARMSFKNYILELLQTTRFWLLMLAYFCFNFSYITCIVLYKDFVSARQLTEHFSAALVAFGAGDIVGRFSSGILSSWRRINMIILFACTHLMCSFLLLLQMTVVYSALTLIIVSFFFGFASGCANGLFYIVPSSMYDKDFFLIAFAFCSAFGGMGSIISTPIAGAVIDSTNSYNGALGMASTASFAAAIFLFALFFTHIDSNVLGYFKQQNHVDRKRSNML